MASRRQSDVAITGCEAVDLSVGRLDVLLAVYVRRISSVKANLSSLSYRSAGRPFLQCAISFKVKTLPGHQ